MASACQKMLSVISALIIQLTFEGVLCEPFQMEYDIVYSDEIPLKASRYIREDAEEKVNDTQITNNAPDNPFEGVDNENDLRWLDDALKDIAYYLRAHKFNEFDRRYETSEKPKPGDYFQAFPRPPLRSLHWEVHKFCEPSFITCVDYLRKRIRNTGLRREDDTSIVIQEQQWDKKNHSSQIDSVESECRKMQKTDNIRGDPFEGPIERFQWRTTASYYMCWYTMNEVPNLKELKENCDNFANCLDPKFGPNNWDPRADDSRAFSCALYSFCPDPCCPQKHLDDFNACWNHEDNPCYWENAEGHRECAVYKQQNTEFRDIVLNRWNVSCNCPEKGYEWDSRFGICVDVDECLGDTHKCDRASEACVNMPGGFECACRWGYSRVNGKCVASPALSVIKLNRSKPINPASERKATSIIKRLFKLIWKSDDE